jgi:hypothetical protein
VQNVVQLAEILPFSIENPSSIQQDHFEHILNIVVSPCILLNKCANNLNVHTGNVFNEEVRDVKGFVILEWLIAVELDGIEFVVR